MIDEKKIEAKLDEIHAELISLRRLVEQQNALLVRGPQRADDLVPVEYLVARTGYRRRTILDGKAGLKPLLKLRVARHPSLWRRADVDSWLSEFARRQKIVARPRLVRRKRRSS